MWTISGGTYDSVLSVTLGNNLGAAPTNATMQVILDAGTLQIRTGGNPALGATRTIQVNGAGGAIADVSGGSNAHQSNIANKAAATSSLYLSNTGGTATFSGVVSGSGGLAWNGTGTLLLSNTNTYAGATVVNAGTLSLAASGSINFSTAVNVTAGASTLSNPAALSDVGTLSLASGTTSNLSAVNGTSDNYAVHGKKISPVGWSTPSAMFTGNLLAACNPGGQPVETPTMHSTMDDIARECGVSKMTVSRVLAGRRASQLGQIAFCSDAGTTFLGFGGILANGETVLVPEPATVFGGLLLVGAAGWHARQRRRIFLSANSENAW